MRIIRISDITVSAGPEASGRSLTFKEKLDTVRLLDKAGVSVIELGQMTGQLTDTLLIKSVAGAVTESTVAVCAGDQPDAIAAVWEALKNAPKPRLQVSAATGIARMEYVSHRKPADVQKYAVSAVSLCREKCPDVEFIAEDATRAPFAFLCGLIAAVIEAGASTVTVCDTAGCMLPDEFGAFLGRLRESVPALGGVTLGVRTSDALHLADACAVAAIAAGAGEVKTSALPCGTASLGALAGILSAKGDALDAASGIRMTELGRILSGIDRACSAEKTDRSPFEDGVRAYSDDMTFTADDSEEDVMKGASYLGYELEPADRARVFKAFSRIAARKDAVGLGELDAIIAAEAMQVPAAYTVESYVVTSGNTIDVVAHVKLRKGGETLDGLSMGDGPIDAAFLAIEKIIGRHYELDDFQLKAITEGREAMGQTVVKLRSGGKVYAGRGISTDIIGSGIAAYVNALNKIAYEEENA